jgi:hypothetical protein
VVAETIHGSVTDWRTFFNKYLLHEDGMTIGCRGGPKGRQPKSGQGAAAEGRTQTARATKYIEFYGGVRLPHVYLPAHSLHILRGVPRDECSLPILGPPPPDSLPLIKGGAGGHAEEIFLLPFSASVSILN